MARESIDSGQAMGKLNDLIRFHECGGVRKMFLEKVAQIKKEEISKKKGSLIP